MKKSPSKTKAPGKPKGIRRKDAKKAPTLTKKLLISNGGVLAIDRGIKAPADAAGDAGMFHFRLMEDRLLRADGVIDAELQKYLDKLRDEIFCTVQNALLGGDHGFFERLVQAAAHVKRGCPVDAKAERILRYYLMRRRDGEPVTSSQIVKYLSNLPDAPAGGVDDGEVRRVCRNLGLVLGRSALAIAIQ
ncbi:MAG: hypothetical protein NTZ46_11775 [Verrucomicrobia bacterium]|nr:hypothetical protein [Verrucomicrobiota bacterium]